MKQNAAEFQLFEPNIELKSKALNKLTKSRVNNVLLDDKVSGILKRELQECALDEVKQKEILIPSDVLRDAFPVNAL